MLVKAKIENNDKIHDINIIDSKQITINQQIQNYLDSIKFETPDNRIFYSLYNPDSHMFMMSFEDIQTCKNVYNIIYLKNDVNDFLKISTVFYSVKNRSCLYFAFLVFNECYFILDKSSTFLIKNCSLEAKNIVSLLQNIYNESIGYKLSMSNSYRKSVELTPTSLSSTDIYDPLGRTSFSGNSRPELKNIVFKLKNYFFVDAFSEEFISYDGIRVLLNLIDTTSGNTRVKI